MCATADCARFACGLTYSKSAKRYPANDLPVLWDSNSDVFKDTEKHHVPHIHAEHQGKVAVYSILDGTVLVGDVPPNKHKLIVAWIEIHQEDLLADWDLAVNGKKPFPIKGLDQ